MFQKRRFQDNTYKKTIGKNSNPSPKQGYCGHLVKWDTRQESAASKHLYYQQSQPLTTMLMQYIINLLKTTTKTHPLT